jgi:hypothetical protein
MELQIYNEHTERWFKGGRALDIAGERFLEDHLVEILFHFIQALAIYS